MKPTPAKPRTIIVQVAGSGIADTAEPKSMLFRFNTGSDDVRRIDGCRRRVGRN